VEGTVRVFIVAPVRAYREALAEALDRAASIRVAGTAADAPAAAQSLQTALPDAILIDPSLPGGTPAIRAIVHAAGEARVVALGVGDDGPELIAYAEAGVTGLVTHDESLIGLTAAIRSATRGELHVSPKAAALLLQRLALLGAAHREPHPTDDLTRREAEVLRLLEDGLTNKQIASELCIQQPTVKQHVHHILAKLNVSRRGEAVALIHRSISD